MSACTHVTPDRWEWQEYEHYITGETVSELVNVGNQWTYEDMGPGRFRCTQCGEVFYYTGRWRDHYETMEAGR